MIYLSGLKITYYIMYIYNKYTIYIIYARAYIIYIGMDWYT